MAQVGCGGCDVEMGEQGRKARGAALLELPLSRQGVCCCQQRCQQQGRRAMLACAPSRPMHRIPLLRHPMHSIPLLRHGNPYVSNASAAASPPRPPATTPNLLHPPFDGAHGYPTHPLLGRPPTIAPTICEAHRHPACSPEPPPEVTQQAVQRHHTPS